MFVRCLILTLNFFESNEPETYGKITLLCGKKWYCWLFVGYELGTMC